MEFFRHSLIDLKPCSTENQIFTTKFNVLNILATKFLFVFIHFTLFFYGRLCVSWRSFATYLPCAFSLSHIYPHIPWVQICKNYHQILMTHLSCSREPDGDKAYTAGEKHVGDKTPENSGDLLLTSRHWNTKSVEATVNTRAHFTSQGLKGN